MKKKLLIFLFSILISFNSYGDWMEYNKTIWGDTQYIDKDSFKEHDGYVYWWRLDDFLEPDERGIMSLKAYYKGDCGQNGIISLALIKFEQPMGEGKGETVDLSPIKLEWEFDRIGSGDMGLSYVCDYFN